MKNKEEITEFTKFTNLYLTVLNLEMIECIDDDNKDRLKQLRIEMGSIITTLLKIRK